jgi:CRISPR-associated protein Csh2
MLKAMWFGTNELATTSKYGQQSRLLLRLCYREPHVYIGDLDRYVSLEEKKTEVEPSKLENISQLVLKVDDLFATLTANVKKIDEIQYVSHDDLKCSWRGEVNKFSEHLNKWHKEIGKPEKILLTNILG